MRKLANTDLLCPKKVVQIKCFKGKDESWYYYHAEFGVPHTITSTRNDISIHLTGSSQTYLEPFHLRKRGDKIFVIDPSLYEK